MASSAMQCDDDNSCQNEARIFCLPQEVWVNIVLNLQAQDLLSLLGVNRKFHMGLGQSANIWRMLSDRDGTSCYEDWTKTPQSQMLPTVCDSSTEQCDWRTEKNRYLFYCHRSNPSKSGGGVHWYPVRPYGRFSGISDREGHISCVLSRHELSDPKLDPMISSMTGNQLQYTGPKERIIVITGGFANDDSLYFINAGTGIMDDLTDNSERHHSWEMKRVDAIGRGPSFVYGASLTALPTLYSETPEGELPRKLTATMRAIRFGGFKAGGYANETSQVLMLTVKQEANRVQKRQRRRRGKRDRQVESEENDDENQWSTTWEWHWNRPWEVTWSNIATIGIPPGENDEQNSPERDFLSRAYHTSTLLLDRYLVVIGGMKASGSVLNEAVLDTKTWTWIGNGRIAHGYDGMDDRPSGRHGHSVILDDTRNRLVLFGGGSGSDLLRSGEDNSEVWELQLGQHWRDPGRFVESFPWKWKKVRIDSNISNGTDDNSTKLSPSQTLCLGRCHHGIKISRDTALFLFGSGRPSTNGLLAYNLKTDCFFQQNNNSGTVHVTGILPKPRFTGVAAFLEEDGYILTHGGYCSQDHDTIGMIDVLDLAPCFRRRLNYASSSFNGLAIDERRISYDEVTDSAAEQGRQDPNAAVQRMIQTLMNTPARERQAVAQVMLDEMRRGERPRSEQTLLFMSMIANGNALFMGDDEEEDLYQS